MSPTLIYCYDAYCGWCYGFSPVIRQLSEKFPALPVEVLSGGMILPEKPVPISATASYIRAALPRVEATTGVQFGSDYRWHIEQPELSDWFPHSEKPAIALAVFRSIHPHRQLEWAADLQFSLFWEGRDLTDDEAYRHLLEKYALADDVFYEKLHNPYYRQLAYEDFATCKKLQVTGYPCVLLQHSEVSFSLLARGFTDAVTLQARLVAALTTGEPS
jgi:putative protein-disulfide isomerase